MTEQHNLLPVNIEDEMRKSYLDYSMSVIIGRALPDVRDGLKPVHRRALYAMQELGNTHNRAYKKSARIVGDVIGKYHPHGDSAVYDTIVRMAQDFSMRYPLVDGQGNFGSVDGDPPAAMRYTEVRMAKLASELLADIDKETVDFGPNYDDSQEEPTILPARFPNLLVNGASGIAVGMATNIPPHNLTEIINATVHLVEHPSATVADLMQFVTGPDFPTGGYIRGYDGIKKGYETGRGSIKMRAKTHIERWGKHDEREAIIVTELPYQVNKARLLEKIAELVKDKRVEGISDLRDESDRQGMRMVIELKRDAIPDVVRNNLFKFTPLETSFGVNLLAIDRGQPRLLTLRDFLDRFIVHRREVVTRRSIYERRKALERFHVLVGLLVATDHIDRVVEIIRSSADPEEARSRLVVERFEGMQPRFAEFVEATHAQIDAALASGVFQLDERQAQAILEMRLSRLTGLEREKLVSEMRELQATIMYLNAILSSDARLLEVIVEELEQIKSEYGDARRTTIVPDAGDISIEDLIADEDMVVTFSHAGYVKRLPVSEYQAQRRGGRGKQGTRVKDEDFVEHLFVASTHVFLLIFTDKGQCYWLKVHEIPTGSRTARGKPIVNLVALQPGEKVQAILPVREFTDDKYVAMFTKKGIVKKTVLSSFANRRAAGVKAILTDEGDDLVTTRLTDGQSELFLSTANGIAIRFPESDVRNMGRVTRGVKAITLSDGDEIVSAAVLSTGPLLSITENGYGKRTPMDEYRVQSRGGKGIINIKTSARNGQVVAGLQVDEGDEIMLITNTGVLIRMKTEGISLVSRNTQGVRLITLNSKDEKVVGVAKVVDSDDGADGDEDSVDGEA